MNLWEPPLPHCSDKAFLGLTSYIISTNKKYYLASLIFSRNNRLFTQSSLDLGLGFRLDEKFFPHFTQFNCYLLLMLTLGVNGWWGVVARLVMTPDRGVLGVPGIGSRKCSLNHLKQRPTVSKTCPRNRNPSGVTVMNSCFTLFLGKYDSRNLPG